MWLSSKWNLERLGIRINSILITCWPSWRISWMLMLSALSAATKINSHSFMKFFPYTCNPPKLPFWPTNRRSSCIRYEILQQYLSIQICRYNGLFDLFDEKWNYLNVFWICHDLLMSFEWWCLLMLIIKIWCMILLTYDY